ncbi:MAG: hypothetical protein FWD64_07200 [Acidobacteriaceae bacterium]|nr:hypothetical protein [Acidobacteriaceae bacterium]
MERLADYEFVIAGIALIAFLAAENLGARIGTRLRPLKDEERRHVAQITGTGLTILALLLGFSFSAAMKRYDVRKACEEEEASAISSEYALADMLPEADAAQVRGLLRQYVRLRILYYENNDRDELASIRLQRRQLEAQVWPIVARNAKASQTPVMGQVLAGMNAVLSRPGYSQAAALDRIPGAVWAVLFALAILCCGLIGFAGRGSRGIVLRFLLPFSLTLSFYVVATLDSQRHGVVLVLPENLVRVEREIQ